MNYIFDTNILIHYIKQSPLSAQINKDYQPFARENVALISIVNEAEIRSIGFQTKWGINKMSVLENFLRQFLIVPIDSHQIVGAYASIDAYSQGKHPTIKLPAGTSSRNMGKNDLWIAATAQVTQSKLLTTDGDFDHLIGRIDVVKFTLSK